MMSSSFSYHKLKKLPPPDAQQDHQDHCPTISVQDCYHHAGAVVARRKITWRSFAGGGRRRRPRLRISSLARVLRRKAAAVGDRVRASMAKVVTRLKEGRPYIGDLFAGNYMFMQVTPSPTMVGTDKGFLPYYYGKTKGKPGSSSCLHPVPGGRHTFPNNPTTRRRAKEVSLFNVCKGRRMPPRPIGPPPLPPHEGSPCRGQREGSRPRNGPRNMMWWTLPMEAYCAQKLPTKEENATEPL